ncbi:MAG: acyl carrier protein [Acidimicrobiales bacterium]|jgi:acyl carrier protein
MDESIRAILAQHGRLSVDMAEVGDDDDLYRMGLTSHCTINVMLALEDAFEIEMPDTMLRKGTFQTIASIRAALIEVTNSTQSA